MEFSRSLSLSILPMLFVSLPILGYCFTFAEAADLISDVCSGTRNPQLCIQSLKSDPESAKADLKGLGKISIELTRTIAKSTRTLVDYLRKNAANTRLKGIYDSCLESYGDAVDYLNDATGLLNSGDYLGMNLNAGAAGNSAGECDDNFSDAKVKEPQNLVDASQKVQFLASIVLVIANRLRGNV